MCVATGHKPTCTAGGCGADTQVASPYSTTISTSNTTFYAVGCAAGLAGSPATASATFDLASTPAALAPQAGGTCGSTVTLEDAVTAGSTADADLGGATPGECFCYTTDGTPPSCSASNCASTGTTSCSTDPQIITAATSETITWATCALGFDSTTGSQVYSTAPYSHTIKADGNLTDWDINSEAVTTVNIDNWGCSSDDIGIGYLSYDATNLYLAIDPRSAINGNYSGECCDYVDGTNCPETRCEPSPTTFIALYIGNGTGNGATDRLLGNESDYNGFFGSLNDYCAMANVLPASAGFTHAIVWQSDGAAAPQTFVWTAGAWAASSFNVTVGFQAATNTPEFQVPLASLGLTSASTVTMLGNSFADATAAAEGAERGSAELFRWPNGGDACTYNSYFSASLGSCLSPVAQSQDTIANDGNGNFVCNQED
jgi:hypothetical protein